jgi:amino acid adenylation domain-containing protein
LEEALAEMKRKPIVLSLEELTKRERETPLGVKRTGKSLAYVIYTSGSTGEPKGVMVEEEGMVNHLEAKVRELSLGEGEVVAQNASQCFDISVWQMLVGLWVGGVTEVIGKEEAASPRRLLEVTEERAVTVLEVVPSMLRAMVEEVAEGGWKPALSKLKWLVATGEALPPETCGKWLEAYPNIPVVNAYGPTECSDDVTHEFLREAPKEANTAVGHALPNLQSWVLGKELEVMPEGVAGELHVGGVGVGRGYFGRPDLTAEKFVPDPWGNGSRLYRTGDLVRRRPDGAVEYLGRVDQQVKVRGFRIELGEIEKVLGKVAGVKDCVVMARGEGSEKQLVGYVVGTVEPDAVKAARRAQLPE